MAANLDSFDLKILTELQKNGAQSNQEVAERVGLSASPCSRRIRQLEEAGVIRERVVRLEPRALGLELTALIHIRMDRHTPERFEQFEAAVRAYPEVQECYLITRQEADYQLKITVPNMAAICVPANAEINMPQEVVVVTYNSAPRRSVGKEPLSGT